MRKAFISNPKISPMNRLVLTACILLIITSANSQSTITALSAKTDSADYFLQKGLLEKQTGRRLESLKNFEKAAKYDANSKSIITEMASANLEMRRYAQALELFKKLETMGDQSAATYKQLMTLCFQLKQNDDVLIYADKLKKSDPSEKVNYYIGRVNYNNENYGIAIKILTDAENEEPSKAEIPYMIAQCYMSMEKYKLAVDFYKKAIQLKPTETNWIYDLGLIYVSLNDNKNAIKCILEAGEKGYKKNSDYLENLGLAYINAGDFDLGSKTLNEVLAKKGSNINLLYTIGEAYYYKGKYEEATLYWDKILEYDKTNASALYMIGMCYQKKGGKDNSDKGMKLCDIAIGMDPSLASYRQKKMMAGL
jgi:tetratricopeptide (TPR) repeat protein